MNLTTKLVIGSALALASVQTFAQVAVPTPPYNTVNDPAAGNGSAFLTLFSNSDTTPYSYDFNLGLNFNDLLPTNGMNTAGTTLTWNLTGLTVPSTVPTTSLVWHVTAASTTGSVATAGAFKMLTTADQTLTGAQIQSLTNTQTLSLANSADHNFLLSIAGTGGNPVVTTTTTDPTYANGKYGTGLNAFSWSAAVGATSSANFFEIISNRANTSAVTVQPQYAGVWSLNLAAKTLTYSVGGTVPLPAGLWLLLSGLAGLGVVGRRKDTGAALAA
jgi:hypothetical protein